MRRTPTHSWAWATIPTIKGPRYRVSWKMITGTGNRSHFDTDNMDMALQQYTHIKQVRPGDLTVELYDRLEKQIVASHDPEALIE